MFCDSFLSLKKQNLYSFSTKPSKNTYVSFGLTVSLATAAICLLNSHQAVATTGFDPHLNLSHQHDSADCQHDHTTNFATGFLPRILSLLPMAVQAQIANWSQGIVGTEHHHHSSSYSGMGGSHLENLTPLYLSQARSTSSKQFGAVNIKPFESDFNSSTNLLAVKPQPQSQTYTVQSGDTINRIARKHQVSRDEIIKLNNIKNSNIIFVTQKLQIPVIKQDTIIDRVAETRKSSQINVTTANLPTNSAVKTNLRSSVSSRRLSQIKHNEPTISSIRKESNQDLESITATAVSLQLPPLPPSEEYLPNAFDGYAWPAQGVLTSGYGWRWGRLHKGIDIAGPIGTPVFAAASGEVVSAGWNSGGYGNLIKLRHLDGSITLYAHNNKILVNSGQKVGQGDQIAEMGNTGFSTGSHLHFEIHSREQGAVNPLVLLN